MTRDGSKPGWADRGETPAGPSPSSDSSPVTRHPSLPRSTWTALTDPQLLAQCAVDTYRASGPGGQKRNKTSSAVRLRHLPTGLLVIAEESRSQHENKAKALARLRRTLYLELRDPPPAAPPAGPLPATPKAADFWPTAGLALDVLAGCGARVSTAAEWFGVSTAQFVGFLALDPRLWQSANRLRAAAGEKPLR